jgi:ATP-dependent DNA helicase RecG
MPTAFATTDELAYDALLAAPLRWPRPSRLRRELKVTPAKSAEAATALGLRTVGDLLEHLPRDRREARTVATLTPGEGATVVVEVRSIASRPVRRRGMKPLVEAQVADETAMMKATFFNQPWLARTYPKGTRLVLHGKLAGRGEFRVEAHAQTTETTGSDTRSPGGSHPLAARPAGDRQATGSEVAHYPATVGLSSTQILALVRAHLPAAHDAVDPLPARVRSAQGMPDRPAAIVAAHAGDLEGGRRRLAFDELLLAQLSLLRRRAGRRAAGSAAALDGPPALTTRWRERLLPFELTGDQRAAIAVVDAELALPRPMQRLLMGEVGSGKTVVALHAILRAVEHDMQAVFMAPTEVLAEQHFATLQALLPGEAVRTALLTGSTTAKRRADTLSKLQTGELSFVVGTHALLEPDVHFDRLAVVVVDEQHRFGVRQRATLDAKAPAGLVPHVLHMTATPIPRTMALLRYGDLDITALRELPKGRRPITTHVASTDAERARAYERIREELDKGRQAFVVCPLVEESEALAARAATAEYERLRGGELADYRVMLLHGQMRPRDKQEAMAAFAAGDADVLVATTVIEVGVDVPNATVMLVEGAERFGISQLHQLRGRIGRGEHASVCLLFGPKLSARLRAVGRCSDGFELARIDLELRGEGEIAGTRQSGLAQFKVARLPDDEALVEAARTYAERLLAADPELEAAENALLADALAAAHGEAQRQPLPA